MTIKVKVDVHEESVHERCMYVNLARFIKWSTVSSMLTVDQRPNARKLHSWRSFRASLLLARPFPTAVFKISVRRIDTSRLLTVAELEVSSLSVNRFA